MRGRTEAGEEGKKSSNKNPMCCNIYYLDIYSLWTPGLEWSHHLYILLDSADSEDKWEAWGWGRKSPPFLIGGISACIIHHCVFNTRPRAFHALLRFILW